MTATQNSDRACCYTCDRLYYEIGKGDCCKITKQPVRPWNDCNCNAHEWQRTAGE